LFQIEVILNPLANYAAFFLLILGIMWIIYAVYEGSRRGTFKKFQTEEWNFDITKFLKVLTFIGFFVGLVAVVSGIAGLILDVAPSVAYASNPEADPGRHLFTSVLLIIIGIFTLMKPINDLPIASILGVLAASAVCIIIALLIPESAVEFIENFVDPKIVLIIIFIIIFAIVALTIKFYTAAIMFFSKVLSWPPLAIVVAIICFVQAFGLLVLGISIIL
jgi:hypothetical protein